MTGFSSPVSTVGPIIARYLALKQALGRQYGRESAILLHLDCFLTSADADLTLESFSEWCSTRGQLMTGVRRREMRVVRNLCLYRRRTDAACFVPDLAQFPPDHQPVQPYIFSEAEITQLCEATETLQPAARSPLRRENFRLALVLLYTTGLRRGELLRMTIGDYDPKEKTLLVRESKFHKSRLLPLSHDGACEVEAYVEIRRAHRLPVGAEAPLLWNGYGGAGAYTGVGFGATIRDLFQTSGLRTAAGRRPRVHDFRHTFAVRALLRWYQAGDDVQAKLPSLATYMGHVSIASTQYYLHFLDFIASSASDRFAQRCGALITAHIEEVADEN